MSAILVAGAVVAANALAQAYIANKQMGAEQDRLNEIKSEFDRIKPPELNVSLDEYIAKNKGNLPDYDLDCNAIQTSGASSINF